MKEHVKPIEIEILQEFYVDAGIARYIEEFNELGYSTKMSCSGMKVDGHDGQNENRPYISFDRPRDLKLNYTEYFKLLTSCFIRLNALEEQKIHINCKDKIFWYLTFQPYNRTNPANLVGMTSYLPLGLKDESINEKLEELLHMLRKIDYFNKLSEKKLENGEEIIKVL